MLKEIYCRAKEDPYADETALDHSNVYETLLGKIRIILSTRKGDVLGDPEFGASLEDFIFDTNFPATEIEDEIKAQIARYVPEAIRFDIKVKVKLEKGVTSDIGFVDIIINGNKEIGVLVN